MEQSRIAERNIVKDEIRQAEVFLKRSNDTIDRLKSQEKSDFNKKQIEKLKLTVKDIETKLAVLNKKYDDILTGNFDKEISERVENNINVIKQKQNLSDKKVKEKNDRKIEDKIILDNEYKSGKKEGLNKYQVARETDKFFNILKELLNYINTKTDYVYFKNKLKIENKTDFNTYSFKKDDYVLYTKRNVKAIIVFVDISSKSFHISIPSLPELGEINTIDKYLKPY